MTKELKEDLKYYFYCYEKKDAGLRKLKKILKQAKIDFNKKTKNKDELEKNLADNEIQYCQNDFCDSWWYNYNPKCNFCSECDVGLCHECEKDHFRNEDGERITEDNEDDDIVCIECVCENFNITRI